MPDLTPPSTNSTLHRDSSRHLPAIIDLAAPAPG